MRIGKRAKQLRNGLNGSGNGWINLQTPRSRGDYTGGIQALHPFIYIYIQTVYRTQNLEQPLRARKCKTKATLNKVTFVF